MKSLLEWEGRLQRAVGGDAGVPQRSLVISEQAEHARLLRPKSPSTGQKGTGDSEGREWWRQ